MTKPSGFLAAHRTEIETFWSETPGALVDATAARFLVNVASRYIPLL